MRCATLLIILFELASPRGQNAHAAAADFVRLNLIDFSIKMQLPPDAAKECVLLKSTAEALSRAQQAAKLVGHSLKVLSCYRPFSSTPKIDENLRRDWARGNTVEVILTESGGGPVALPEPHDHAIMLSAKQYKKVEAKKNVAKLNALMNAEGFAPDPKVWWRFSWLKAAQSAIEDFAPDSLPKR